MQREEMIAAIETTGELWDVIIIGGGATGLGAALEATTRGHRTVLVEAHDFAKGTSSRSTKLVHGGVRYLRQGQIGMVRQSLQERERLLNNAPHIVHPLQFVIPSYSSAGSWFYYAGLKTYDFLAGKTEFPGARLLSRQQVLENLPTLREEKLRGGVQYSDGQFDDARLAISLAQTIHEHQGVVLNYAPVISMIHQGDKLTGVVVLDKESGREISLNGRVVVNATGVFADEIMNLDEESLSDIPRHTESAVMPSQGSHLVLDRSFMPGDAAMMIPETKDGRVLFAIPWHNHLLFGTTDLPVERVAFEPRPLEEEVDYLIEYAGMYLSKKPTENDILSQFSGLRPLVRVKSAGQSTASLSREHDIRTSPSGLISIIGGKWTTYRHMGEQLIDLAEKVGELKACPSQTATLPLHGAPVMGKDRSLSAEDEFLKVYGNDVDELRLLSEKDPSLGKQLHPRLPYLASQVVWAARHEMARTVEDVLARRTRALFLDAQATLTCAPHVASLLMQVLGRSENWKREQIESFEKLARGYCSRDDG